MQSIVSGFLFFLLSKTIYNIKEDTNMLTMTKEELENLRKQYPAGTVVRLIKMDDIQAPPVGTLGTVRYVDDIATIHVSWETGSSLGIVYGIDEIEKLS